MRTDHEVLLVVYRPGPEFLVLLRSAETAQDRNSLARVPVARKPLKAAASRPLCEREHPVAEGSYWHLVAGGIESGEEPDEAALRELEEETGLVAPPRFEPLPLALGYRRPQGGAWITLHPFVVEASPGWEPRLNEEHVDYRWCSEPEAEELLAYPEPREALRLVARQLGVVA